MNTDYGIDNDSIYIITEKGSRDWKYSNKIKRAIAAKPFPNEIQVWPKIAKLQFCLNSDYIDESTY